jgi:hypothetical protein
VRPRSCRPDIADQIPAKSVLTQNPSSFRLGQLPRCYSAFAPLSLIIADQFWQSRPLHPTLLSPPPVCSSRTQICLLSRGPRVAGEPCGRDISRAGHGWLSALVGARDAASIWTAGIGWRPRAAATYRIKTVQAFAPKGQAEDCAISAQSSLQSSFLAAVVTAVRSWRPSPLQPRPSAQFRTAFDSRRGRRGKELRPD